MTQHILYVFIDSVEQFMKELLSNIGFNQMKMSANGQHFWIRNCLTFVVNLVKKYIIQNHNIKNGIVRLQVAYKFASKLTSMIKAFIKNVTIPPQKLSNICAIFEKIVGDAVQCMLRLLFVDNSELLNSKIAIEFEKAVVQSLKINGERLWMNISSLNIEVESLMRDIFYNWAQKHISEMSDNKINFVVESIKTICNYCYKYSHQFNTNYIS